MLRDSPSCHVLDPCVFVLVYYLFISCHSPFHKGSPWALSFWICPHLCPEQMGGRGGWGGGQPGASATCVPALPLTDFLEVGVLPQQLSNHINYAASNLPTSSLNTPCLRHVAWPPWECRVHALSMQFYVGRRELASLWIIDCIHSFYSFFS